MENVFLTHHWELGIGRVTKRRAVAIVPSAITDLPTHPPKDFSFVGCLNVMFNFVIWLASHLSRGMLCVHFLGIWNKGQVAAVGLAWLPVVCEKCN